MASEPKLPEIFYDILGTRNVYFQPPASIKMQYPAIVYSRKNIVNSHANNEVYIQSLCYEVTVIDYKPNSEIVMQVSRLPMCTHDRHFEADNLNHDVFTLYI